MSIPDHSQGTEFVPRSREHLLNYPPAFRWEITRRHPYYLGLWQAVVDYHRNFPNTGNSPDEAGFAAKLAMGAIGVGGEPVSPTLSFDDIGGNDPSFLCGTVQPMTLRNLLSVVLTALGPDNQDFLADQLIASASNLRSPDLTPEEKGANILALGGLIAMRPDPELDTVPAAPLFYFHLGASQETIKEDANRQARLWKAKRGMPSPKVHTAKLNEYLEVWDRFEGWTGSGYDVDREQTLKAIAGSMNERLSTLYDRYRAAFRAIFGHDFSSRRWCNTMGRFKFASYKGDAVRSHLWLARRRLTDTKRQATTSATPPAGTGGNHPTDSDGDSAEEVLYAKILRLVHDGATDDQIIKQLELTDPLSGMLLQYLRDRLAGLDPLEA